MIDGDVGKGVEVVFEFGWVDGLIFVDVDDAVKVLD